MFVLLSAPCQLYICISTLSSVCFRGMYIPMFHSRAPDRTGDDRIHCLVTFQRHLSIAHNLHLHFTTHECDRSVDLRQHRFRHRGDRSVKCPLNKVSTIASFIFSLCTLPLLPFLPLLSTLAATYRRDAGLWRRCLHRRIISFGLCL